MGHKTVLMGGPVLLYTYSNMVDACTINIQTIGYLRLVIWTKSGMQK